MQTLLGTGLSGMVGSSIMEELQHEFEFQNMSLETGIDITDPEVVDVYVSGSKARWIIHLAAITSVDDAEKDRELGEASVTWKVNVGATEHLVAAAKKYDKKILYVSTDFVFPGGEKVYTETDEPNPIGWYAITKYEGEKRVLTLGDQGIIMRLSFPYGHTLGPKKDFVGRIRELLANGKEVISPTDQLFTPTFLPDISKGISLLINANASGIYHVVGGNTLSSFDASCTIADVFGYNKNLVKETVCEHFYAGRAPRATRLTVSHTKISALGLTPVTFQQGLDRLKAEEI